MFKRYLSLSWFITIAGFSISIAWIIMSATRHSTAQANCEKDYYSTGSTGDNAASLASEADTVCNIFSWVDVGVMGGLWVVLLLMQVSAENRSAWHGHLIESRIRAVVHAHRCIVVWQGPTNRQIPLQ